MTGKTRVRAGKCRVCGNQIGVGDDVRYRPFCSERCQMVDLGKWFGEGYAIPAEEEVPDEHELELELERARAGGDGQPERRGDDERYH